MAYLISYIILNISLNLLYMKLQPIFFVLLFIIFTLTVKANNSPISVYANESITVTLFFPSEITKVIQPANNYKFEYEENTTMATLVAKKGAASNLTVITKCGSIFSFLVNYEEKVSNFTYVLSSEHAIGKMKDSGTVSITQTIQPKNKLTPKFTKLKSSKKKLVVAQEKASLDSDDMTTTSDSFSKETKAKTKKSIGKGRSLYETNTEDYYSVFCENNYDQGLRLSKQFISGLGVSLQLKAITADKNELYFVLGIDNTLDVDFNTKDLNFYVRSGQLDTPLEITPVYVFNSPKTVASNGKTNVVYVFKEFKLSSNEKIHIVMDEVGGAKKRVMLTVNSHTINSAGN